MLPTHCPSWLPHGTIRAALVGSSLKITSSKNTPLRSAASWGASGLAEGRGFQLLGQTKCWHFLSWGFALKPIISFPDWGWKQPPRWDLSFQLVYPLQKDNALTRFYGQIKYFFFVSEFMPMIASLKSKIFPFNKCCAILALNYIFSMRIFCYISRVGKNTLKIRGKILWRFTRAFHNSLWLSALIEMDESQVGPLRGKSHFSFW